MTEEEAKKTRCCVSGCGQVVDYNVHRNSLGDIIAQVLVRNCMGSACMAWRWDVPDPATYEGRAPGFCGLAGKP